MTIKTILVVDDSPTDRQHLTDVLTKAGYKVTGAASAEEALAKVKQAKPDLVLMDVVMPGQNGFQATRALSTDEATKHIPVVAFTANAMSGDREKAIAAGCDDFDTKPVELPRLLGKIRALAPAGSAS